MVILVFTRFKFVDIFILECWFDLLSQFDHPVLLQMMLKRLLAYQLRFPLVGISSHDPVSSLRSDRVHNISVNMSEWDGLDRYSLRFDNFLFIDRFQLWLLGVFKLDDVYFLIQSWLWSHFLHHPILWITRPHSSAFRCLWDWAASVLQGFLCSSTFVVFDCEANADLWVAHSFLSRLLISSIHGGISSWPVSAIIHTFKIELRIICELRNGLSLFANMDDAT